MRDLESMCRDKMLKILLQQYRHFPDIPECPLLRRLWALSRHIERSRFYEYTPPYKGGPRGLANGETQADIALTYAVEPTTIGRLLPASASPFAARAQAPPTSHGRRDTAARNVLRERAIWPVEE